MPLFPMPKKGVKLSALHIDDSRWIRIPVSVMLRRHFGMKVLEANSGQEGILLAQMHIPDVIILDLMMPQMDGFDTLVKLKEDIKTKNIPVLMCTARDMTKDVNLAIKLGAVGYITKPIEEENLLEQVQHVLVAAGKWGNVTVADPRALDHQTISDSERVVPKAPTTSPQTAEAPAEPPAPQEPKVPARNCPFCRSVLEFIEQYNAWYCYTCRKYPDVEVMQAPLA